MLDLPALGKPTSPASASERSSRVRRRWRPGSPFSWDWRSGGQVRRERRCRGRRGRPLPARNLAPRAVPIGQQLAVGVADQGPDRHRQGPVVAVGPPTVVPLAVRAAAGPLVGVEVVLDQGADTQVGDEQNVAASTAVAAVGPAPRFVLLPVERGHTVATAPGGHLDGGLIYKQRGPRWEVGAGYAPRSMLASLRPRTMW